jgi:hypothetical protein
LLAEHDMQTKITMVRIAHLNWCIFFISLELTKSF